MIHVNIILGTRENVIGVTTINQVTVYDESGNDVTENYMDILAGYSEEQFFDEDETTSPVEWIARKLNIPSECVNYTNEFFETPWDD